jgi:hypothetical protein
LILLFASINLLEQPIKYPPLISFHLKSKDETAKVNRFHYYNGILAFARTRLSKKRY